uniref:Transposase n=1 Tax=Globodera rostochiensis TaxID=31243 RepID=A0A914H1M5_GLORO
MDNFWILILVSFFATNSLDKTESVQLEELEELPLQTFDELFVDEWWDKDEAEDLETPVPTNFGQNAHHQIDRQNTQIGQIEPNSTDQNPPLTESDDSDNANSSKNIAEDEQKCKIIEEFHAIKDEFKQKGKYSNNEWNQIEDKIAKHLKVNRAKIYKWKKEFGISQKVLNEKEERKHLVEKFDQMKAKLIRDGFKNSYKQEIDKTVAKEMGFCFQTIYNWKRELGQTTPKHKHSHSEQKELMKRYYKIKGKIPKISDEDIAKMLKIGASTLVNWKKQFKQHQLHLNSVDGHSVEENAGSNVQEIDKSNAGII